MRQDLLFIWPRRSALSTHARMLLCRRRSTSDLVSNFATPSTERVAVICVAHLDTEFPSDLAIKYVVLYWSKNMHCYRHGDCVHYIRLQPRRTAVRRKGYRSFGLFMSSRYKQLIISSPIITVENSLPQSWECLATAGKKDWTNAASMAWRDIASMAWRNRATMAWRNAATLAWRHTAKIAWRNTATMAWRNTATMALRNTATRAWTNAAKIAWTNTTAKRAWKLQLYRLAYLHYCSQIAELRQKIYQYHVLSTAIHCNVAANNIQTRLASGIACLHLSNGVIQAHAMLDLSGNLCRTLYFWKLLCVRVASI